MTRIPGRNRKAFRQRNLEIGLFALYTQVSTMKHQIDFLFGGILFSVFVGVLGASGTPLQGSLSAFHFPGTYLVSAAPSLMDPAPVTYKLLGKMGRVVIGQHTVKPKETLSSLAKDYGSTATSLRSTNRLESPYLSPGKTVMVHSGDGMLHQVQEVKGQTETLELVAEKYNQSAAKIALANRLPGVAILSKNWLQPGDLLFIPDARLRFTDYDFPVAWVRGKRLISSGFGMRRHPVFRYKSFHKGWDMPRPYGTPVKSSRDGQVIFAGWRTGYGRLVIVKHSGGLRTWYGHLSKITVTPGQKVKRGQLVGRVGSTGISTGPHLHFEVRDRFGNSLNPKKFLF